MKIGVLGAGSFARRFIPLFQAHPLVDDVYLAEVLPERRREEAERFGVRHTFGGLDELLRSDCDAVAIFSQRWLHGPQALQALRAGRHVYSAVPAGVTLEQIGALVDAVRETGLTYMLGETSYYYPVTLYCRERFQKGDFGRFVYAEGEYLHDMSHGFYEAYQHSGGDRWKETASFPPMLYPSHSVSMPLSVTGAHTVSVSCLGWRDDADDGVFREDVSLWKNPLSNETALFRTSDGGMVRINEFRRIGLATGTSVRMSFYGTKASFEEQTNARVWNTLEPHAHADVSDLLRCGDLSVPEAERAAVPAGLRDDFFKGVSKLHPIGRLPNEFVGLGNGHEGSHQFLVCDFLEAIAEKKVPPNHVWAAARYCVPGIVAHESAKLEGEQLEVPDFGDPPGEAI